MNRMNIGSFFECNGDLPGSSFPDMRFEVKKVDPPITPGARNEGLGHQNPSIPHPGGASKEKDAVRCPNEGLIVYTLLHFFMYNRK